MRLIEVIPHVGNEASGPSYGVVRMAQSLAHLDNEVLLLSVLDGQLPATPGFEHRVFPKARMPASLWRSPGLHRALRDEAARADVVHGHGMWVMPAVYPGWLVGKARCPVVLSPRGSLSAVALARSALKKRLFWPLMHSRAYRSAACLHATSEREYEDIRAFGLDTPVAVVPNGIDVPDGLTPKSAGPGPRTLLYLGRIHPIKGLDLLLRVWKRLADGPGEGWTLRLVGPDEGGHQRELEAMVRDLAIPRVEFAGPAFGAAKHAEYARADLYVLPTTTENYGMTIAEALACGTPVLTTRCAPWPELEPRGCGWWVTREDAAFEQALDTALRLAPGALAEMGARGRAWMRGAFGWDALAAEMNDVYRWLAGAPDASPPACVRLA